MRLDKPRDARLEGMVVTFNVAELAPGTYVYLDADDEILMIGALDESSTPDEFEDSEDTDPFVSTMVGPLVGARLPARANTLTGMPIVPRPPARKR